MIGRWIFIRDGRLPRRSKLALGLLVLVILFATVPLRLVLGAFTHEGGLLSAQAVTGSVWNGRAAEVRLAGLPLGVLDMSLRPLPLLTGRTEFAVERPRQGDQGAFAATVGGGNGHFVLKRANGELPLAGAMAPLPTRAVSMVDFSMEMSGGACLFAGGRLGLIVPALMPALPAETVLSGPARCDGGALVVPMTGPTGAETLRFRLEGDGTWRADLTLAGLPVEISAPLLDMGFTPLPDGVGMRAGGAL